MQAKSSVVVGAAGGGGVGCGGAAGAVVGGGWGRWEWGFLWAGGGEEGQVPAREAEVTVP